MHAVTLELDFILSDGGQAASQNGDSKSAGNAKDKSRRKKDKDADNVTWYTDTSKEAAMNRKLTEFKSMSNTNAKVRACLSRRADRA